MRPGQQPMQYYSSLGGASVFDETKFFNYLVGPTNHYPRPGLNLVIKSYKLALLPTASIDKAFLVIVLQFSIGRMIERRQNTITITELIEPVSIFLTVGVIAQL